MEKNAEGLYACRFCKSTNVSSGELSGSSIREGISGIVYQAACLDCGNIGPESDTLEGSSDAWNKLMGPPDVQDLPAVLFDTHAVWCRVNDGRQPGMPHIHPTDVADVLDAVVKMIKADVRSVRDVNAEVRKANSLWRCGND